MIKGKVYIDKNMSNDVVYNINIDNDSNFYMLSKALNAPEVSIIRCIVISKFYHT